MSLEVQGSSSVWKQPQSLWMAFEELSLLQHDDFGRVRGVPEKYCRVFEETGFPACVGKASQLQTRSGGKGAIQAFLPILAVLCIKSQ